MLYWRCPACQLPINHHPHETHPQAGAVYRCHVCRLELTLDVATEKLVVPPFPEAGDETARAQRADRKTSPRE